MHISDGIVSAPLSAACLGVAGVLTAVTLRSIKRDAIPKTAVVTAAFFVASLVHIRLGPTSVHLTLNGLAGILLGPAAFPAIVVGLLFQALLLGHGGLASLGVNACSMGVPALLAWLLFGLRRFSDSAKTTSALAAACGIVAVSASVLAVALILAFTDRSYIPLVKIATAANGVLALVEGVMNGLIVGFLLKVKPELVPYGMNRHTPHL